MSNAALDPELSRRLDELGEGDHDEVVWSEVRDVLESVLGTLDGDITKADVEVYREIQSLSRYIETTRHELSLLGPELIPDEHIPAAQDELDAVVSATEEATNVIMEAAELIEETAEKVGDEFAATLTEATTKIYEACSFQDITGQRINKVVTALKAIEEKVDAIIATFTDDEGAKERVNQRQDNSAQTDAATNEIATDHNLLNGPQMPDDAINQDDIDALLAGLD
jgi:chemotaxis protein CheZ